MAKPALQIAAYLAALPDDQHAALETLRALVQATVPQAEEHFGYAMPSFKYRGRPLVYIGAAKKHCALYGMIPAAFAERLQGYSISKGSVRFTPDKPLPEKWVKDLLLHKRDEIERRWPAVRK
ncbi:MAG: DUF1801 domain-containing protein [Flavobacteriales bacterium]|nr:DUF1801 domain-containing protein [Flavobacteriales bacterium]